MRFARVVEPGSGEFAPGHWTIHDAKSILARLYGVRMPPRIVVCCLVLAVACSTTERSPPASADAFWFDGARLIVGDGSEPVENAAVLVEGDTIAWAGPASARTAPQGAVRVDVS